MNVRHRTRLIRQKEKIGAILSDKRSAILEALPDSAEGLMKHINWNVIRDLSLHRLKPCANRGVGTFREIEKKDINYLFPDPNVMMSDEYETMLCAIGLSSWYSEDFTVNLPSLVPHILLGTMLTILGTFCDVNVFQEVGIRTKWEKKGYVVSRIGFTLEELFSQFAANWAHTQERMDLKRLPLLDCRIPVLIMSFTLIAEMRAFSGQLRWTDKPESIGLPALKVYTVYYRFVFSSPYGRDSVFSAMWILAQSRKCAYSKVFLSIMHNMFYAEMTHIGMIEEHILRQNPDILTMAEFGMPERTACADMLTALSRYPPEVQPVLRYLHSRRESRIFNLKHNTLLHAAARTIAVMTRGNISNLVANDNQAIKDFQAKVQAFVNKKHGLSDMMHSEFLLTHCRKK